MSVDGVAEETQVSPEEEGQLDGLPRCEEAPNLNGELDDAEIAGLQAAATKLLHRRKELGGAIMTMVQAFRLHNTASLAMMRILEEERANERLSLFFSGAARNEARKPFKREELAETLGKKTLPWLLEEIAHEQHLDSLDETKEKRRQEEARREAPVRWPYVDLPIEAFRQGDLAAMPRNRTLAVVGPLDEVRLAIRALALNAMDAVRTVYCHELLAGDPSDARANLVVIGKSQWLNAGESERLMATAFHEAFHALGELDLLLVADMDDFSSSMTSLSSAAKAASGHRRLRKFADHLGCALVIGVPTTEEAPYDVSQSGWSNLTTYAHVHLVAGAHVKS
jgi:hypothetical protein